MSERDTEVESLYNFRETDTIYEQILLFQTFAKPPVDSEWSKQQLLYFM